MKVSIFQPTYLSWLGFYKAIAWADKFVFLDDVQYESHSWQSRNRIKTATGELILTVPIIRNFPQNINRVKINYSCDWIKGHLKSIQMNYSRANFFKESFPLLESFYKTKPESLLELNVGIIKGICKFLDIKTDLYFSSNLGVGDLQKNKKVVAILKKMEVGQYLYAEGAWEYMEKEIDLYRNNKIQLVPLKFVHPVYRQLYGEFVPRLSIIDIIFNCGKDKTIEIIKNIKL
ncbi:MAG: WbqC family protein [Patescibacteria group bacterium]